MVPIMHDSHTSAASVLPASAITDASIPVTLTTTVDRFLETFLANASLSIVLNHSRTSNMSVGEQTNRTLASGAAQDSYNSQWNVQLIWSVIFGSMISIGLVANMLVIATIGGHKSLHTVTNCFLLNLTVSDLVTLLFNATFNFVFMLTGHWPFGNIYCIVNNFITNLTIAISVFTIMFTSKERYNAIVHPLRKRITKQRAFLHIFVIWLASSMFAFPMLIFSRTSHVRVPYGPDKGQILRTVCHILWPDGYQGKSKLDFVYNLLFLVLTYLLPLMTMAIAYTLMARVLWGSKQIGETTQAQVNLVCSKQKVVRMLICVVAVFGVCWLPYHVYFLSTYQWPELVESKSIQHIYLAIYWLAMSNSMFNPIILLLMNKRRALLHVQRTPLTLPMETCNTAITVAEGPHHRDTTTVLLCNGKSKRYKHNLDDDDDDVKHKDFNGNHRRTKSEICDETKENPL